MTAESLKPFISLPSAENFSSHKRSSLNLITIGVGATLVTLSVVLLGYTIWNSVRIHELQKEVHSLNRVMVEMQKRLGLDYLADFNELENTYDNILVDDPNPYNHDDEDDNMEAEDDDEDEDEDDDDVDGNIGEERIRDTFDYTDDDILDGSGLYDDDDDGDDDSNYDNEFDDSSIDKIVRKPRSIASASNGIPIYQDSYATKRNRTGGPEDERIEQHLLANKGLTPTLRPRPAPSTTEDSILARRGRYQSAPGNVLRPLHQTRQRIHRQYRNQRMLRPLLKSGKGRGKSQAMTARSMPILTAVHFHLNSTISGKHNLRPDHSKLPHDGDVYIGSPQPWARALGLDKGFSLNHGILTVKEPGLYFIYAQIYYDNRYDRNGFVVYHNVQPFLQCALFVPTNTNKSHTCYTSGVIYLEGNDELHLRDIHQDRGVMLTNAKSFIGIIKLGEI